MTSVTTKFLDLKSFTPLNELSDQQLVLVQANSERKSFDSGDLILNIGEHDKNEYFLSEGKVELESFDGRFSVIEAGTDKSKTAIALLQPRKYNVKALTPCTFIVVSQEIVNTLLKEQPVERSVYFGVSDLHTGHEVEDIATTFRKDLETNNLQLPSFPDVALKIRKLLDDPNVSVSDVSKLLKNDPAITVKILKTCNSALYRTANEITSSEDAIVRLGFNTTRQLVTIFAMQEVFRSDNKFLQRKMSELWQHSREVASISYVLAKQTPGMNPELALLAGLIQDIGIIPVLTYIERYPQFMRLEHKVDSICRTLKNEIGSELLKSWSFQDSLVEVAENSENWKFQSQGEKPTYADITIAAQLHSYIGKKDVALPPFSEVVSFKKLGHGGLTPKESQKVLHDSKQQIKDIQSMLGATA